MAQYQLYRPSDPTLTALTAGLGLFAKQNPRPPCRNLILPLRLSRQTRRKPEVFDMEYRTSLIMDDGVVVPESALLRREKVNRYGSVPGLPDEEPADPDELERQVYKEEFGPVLKLPLRERKWRLRPAVDESGGVDWGAFGTVDFDRIAPVFDKVRYKADKLREERDNVLIMLGIVARRVRRPARKQVLKCLRQGTIELEDIADEDMFALAKLTLKAVRLQREIAALRNRSKAMAERNTAVLLA